MFDWCLRNLPLILLLPPLLGGCAFFSGMETALFGLRPHERASLRRRNDRVARAALALLAQPQMLLITLLLGSMLVNVLFFVASSVLLQRLGSGALGAVGTVAGSIVVIAISVLFGEVTPKLLAARRAQPWLVFGTIPLLALFRALTPVRTPLARFIIQPLVRLAAPRAEPHTLDSDELTSFLEITMAQGVIHPAERELLDDVVQLSRWKVRDIMLPRVDVVAVPVTVRREVILRRARTTQDTRLPVYRRNLDHIVGLLNLGRYLLDPAASIADALIEPTFVPELATLDHLIAHFRTTHTKTAIAVDEYGQTAGVVTLDDLVRSLVAPGTPRLGKPRRLAMMTGLGRWRVPGSMNVHEFAQAFDIDVGTPRVSTLAGLFVEHAGELGQEGDSITLGHCRLSIAEMKGTRILSLDVEMIE